MNFIYLKRFVYKDKGLSSHLMMTALLPSNQLGWKGLFFELWLGLLAISSDLIFSRYYASPGTTRFFIRNTVWIQPLCFLTFTVKSSKLFLRLKLNIISTKIIFILKNYLFLGVRKNLGRKNLRTRKYKVQN